MLCRIFSRGLTLGYSDIERSRRLKVSSLCASSLTCYINAAADGWTEVSTKWHGSPCSCMQQGSTSCFCFIGKMDEAWDSGKGCMFSTCLCPLLNCSPTGAVWPQSQRSYPDQFSTESSQKWDTLETGLLKCCFPPVTQSSLTWLIASATVGGL